MAKVRLRSILQLPNTKKWNRRKFQENLTHCYNHKLFTDAEIIIRGKTFKAHKNILSFYSPLFQKAFYGIKNPSSIVVMNDITAEGFAILLRFLYCSELPDKVKEDDFMEAYIAAQTLEMVGIKEKLINHILLQTTPGKCGKGKSLKSSKLGLEETKFWSLLQKSHALKCKELEEMLLNFVESRFISLLCKEDFAKVDSETIKLVLNKKPLDLPEKFIFERIAHWKDSNSHLNMLDQSVQELLGYVDFEKLSPKEFYTVVSEHDNLMSGKDCLNILMHLVDPTVCSLPKWYVYNDCCNMRVNLNRESVNSKVYPKADKFKSLNDLQSMNNLSSTTDRGKSKAPFQSQEDLRTIPYIENLGNGKAKNSVFQAKSCNLKLSKSFRQMLDEGLFTNVTLIAKDGTKIPAHRLVLAVGSAVFANIFYATVPLKTLIMDETAEEVNNMLKYFYGSEERISLKGLPSQLHSVLRKTDIALKYRCYPLLKACITALSSVTIDPSICWALLNQKNQMANCKIQTADLMKYVMAAIKDLFDYENFYKASKNALVKVLKCDYLNMAESDILEYVAKWLKANAKDFSTDHSKKKLLMHIRFQALNAEQFFAFAQKYDDLLPKDDCFAILTFLFRKSEENRLPEWCYCGPLRSIFYDACTQIGTNVPIPWKSKSQKGSNTFTCTCTAIIANKRPESEVQFLELSLKYNFPNSVACGNRKFSITVTYDAETVSETVTFEDLILRPYQRLILPIFFTLNNKTPRISFTTIVRTNNHHHKIYSIKKPKMCFDNVEFEVVAGYNCISDAIVDGFTSERILIPKNLLLKNRHIFVSTEKYLKTTTEEEAQLLNV